MAFFRNPKGVYVRQSPDLFQNNCGWGWVAGINTGTGFEDGGIQNLDNQGRVMLVWGVQASIVFPNTTAHPSAQMVVGWINGVEGASGFGTVTPMNPLQGNFTSRTWDQPTGNGIDDSQVLFQILAGEGQMEFFPTYPIAAIPTGWSIATSLGYIVGGASISFSWAFFVEFVGPQP